MAITIGLGRGYWCRSQINHLHSLNEVHCVGVLLLESYKIAESFRVSSTAREQLSSRLSEYIFLSIGKGVNGRHHLNRLAEQSAYSSTDY